MKSFWAAGVVWLALMAFNQPAVAGKEDNSIVFAVDMELETLDFYSQSQREGFIFMRLVWDTLIWRDPDNPGQYQPALATSWEWIEPTLLELKLREGVTFHNGEKFDADDVLYTVAWVLDKENDVRLAWMFDWVDGAEKVDEYTVRLKLKTPFSPAIEYIAAGLPIYPNEYHADVGAEGMRKAPIGTGPYRFVEQVRGQQIVVEKNQDYYSGSPTGTPSIDKVVFRPIPDKATQVAELLSGGVDWIWQVPPDQSEAIASLPNLKVTSGEELRLGFLVLDAAGLAEQTPLTDVRVRRAINHAVDREAMVDNLMGEASRVIHAACHPMQVACPTEGIPQYDYDPETARKLLAEAGYPQGFSIDLYAYRDRQFAEAIIGYLRAVGINANLRWVRYPALRQQVLAHETPFFFMTFGGASIYDSAIVTSFYLEGEGQDYARDQDVIDLVVQAKTELDPERRKALYVDAFSRWADQAYWLPLFTYSVEYAYDTNLDFRPTPDGVPLFATMSWN